MNGRDDRLELIRTLRNRLKGVILIDEPLAKHTSFRIGGPADWYVMPKHMEDLRFILDLCKEKSIPWFVIGRGTNLLVSDAGFRGMVIDLSLGFNQIDSEGETVTAGAGLPLHDLLQYATQFGLSGLERLIGIPGSVGGGVVLNAGAFGCEIFDTLLSVRLLEETGDILNLHRQAIHAGYRFTDLPRGILLEAVFALESGHPPSEIQNVQAEILHRRREKQPLSLPSAGSVFKRPEGDYAGRLIEEAGCKGLRIGDAMVSRKHANFIVNVHMASAQDVIRLIREVRERVYRRFGVTLEPEIHFLGFDDDVLLR